LDESGSESDPSATKKKEDVAKEALRLLDDALKRRNVFVAAAFCSAVRDAAASRRRDKRGPGSFSYGGERPFSFSEGSSRSKRDAFWDGVASRVAAVTVAAFGDESSIDVFAKTNDVATRRRLASLCFGAARGILEAEDDEARNAMASDVPKNAKSALTRRDALVPALRALVSASIPPDSRTGINSTLLDASDGALAEAMLRDEDWRLVAAAEAAAMEAASVARAGGMNPATTKAKRSYGTYAPSVSVPSASEMRRAMFGGSKKTVASSVSTTHANDKAIVGSSASSSVSTALNVANEDQDPSSPAAPSIDFATLVGEAAPVVATSDLLTAETVATELNASEKDAPKETNGKRQIASSTSMSSKMFSAMPSAPKMAKMPSLPKNPFGK
jgi:hypothetical protein